MVKIMRNEIPKMRYFRAKFSRGKISARRILNISNFPAAKLLAMILPAAKFIAEKLPFML